jgi:hypothetical protein
MGSVDLKIFSGRGLELNFFSKHFYWYVSTNEKKLN